MNANDSDSTVSGVVLALYLRDFWQGSSENVGRLALLLIFLASFSVPYFIAALLGQMLFRPDSVSASVVEPEFLEAFLAIIGLVGMGGISALVSWRCWVRLKDGGWWPFARDEGLAPITDYARETALLAPEGKAGMPDADVKRYSPCIEACVLRFREYLDYAGSRGDGLSPEDESELAFAYEERLWRVAHTAKQRRFLKLAQWRIRREEKRLLKRDVPSLQASLVCDPSLERLSLFSREAFSRAARIVETCRAPSPQWEIEDVVGEMHDLSQAVRGFNRASATRLFKEGEADARFVFERGCELPSDRIENLMNRLDDMRWERFKQYLLDGMHTGESVSEEWVEPAFESLVAEETDRKKRLSLFKTLVVCTMAFASGFGLLLQFVISVA